ILTADIAVGRWHQLAFHVHWSTSAQTGNIIVWVDGEKVVDEKAQTKPDGNALFFQAGIHRAGQSSLVDTVFLDNFVEGDSLDDIMVMPGGSDAGADQDAAPGADGADDAGSGGASGRDDNGSGGSLGPGGAPGLGATGGDPGGPSSLIAPSSCAVSSGGSPTAVGLLAVALLISTAISVRRRRPC
ncbi:MAG TPA: heparin lyase I family protein, partial [Polyangia bacterium]|nr:heparin lyase I family protein [Polyangia bacterium]